MKNFFKPTMVTWVAAAFILAFLNLFYQLYFYDHVNIIFFPPDQTAEPPATFQENLSLFPGAFIAYIIAIYILASTVSFLWYKSFPKSKLPPLGDASKID